MEIWPLKKHDARTVVNVLVTQFFSRFGAPQRLHSDQGREFESQLFREVCEMWGIDKTRTTPYSPWSDGMVERANRSIQQMLVHHVRSDKGRWDWWLWAVAMSYNTTVHKSTGETPFRLFLSRCEDPTLPADLVYGGRHGGSGRVLCPTGYLEVLQHRMVLAYDRARMHLRASAKDTGTRA